MKAAGRARSCQEFHSGSWTLSLRAVVSRSCPGGRCAQDAGGGLALPRGRRRPRLPRGDRRRFGAGGGGVRVQCHRGASVLLRYLSWRRLSFARSAFLFRNYALIYSSGQRALKTRFIMDLSIFGATCLVLRRPGELTALSFLCLFNLSGGNGRCRRRGRQDQHDEAAGILPAVR